MALDYSKQERMQQKERPDWTAENQDKFMVNSNNEFLFKDIGKVSHKDNASKIANTSQNLHIIPEVKGESRQQSIVH